MLLNKTAKCWSDLGPCACPPSQTAAVCTSSPSSSALTTTPRVFFFISFSLLYLRLQSCFLLCPVSVGAVNCLSPKTAGFLSRTLYSASCCQNSIPAITTLASTGVVYVISFSFALFPSATNLVFRISPTNCAGRSGNEFKVHLYFVSLFSALTRTVRI